MDIYTKQVIIIIWIIVSIAIIALWTPYFFLAIK